MKTLFIISFSLLSYLPIEANITVSLDGSGDFTTIRQAIENAPNFSMSIFTIQVKKGVYNEIVRVGAEKWNLTLIGDGMESTIISYNLSFAHHDEDSATLAVEGFGFMAINLSVENTAGPENGPAVAIRCNSEQSIFYRVGIYGFQDTLFAKIGKQFYRECRISGTVDFIFGAASAVFQKCEILAREALPHQGNAITANSRDTLDGPLQGFSFHQCNITGDDSLLNSSSPTPTYFGRPWRQYATVVFMQSYIDWIVNPKGWMEWNVTFEPTVFYGEYMNSGPGSSTENRVNWPGCHPKMDTATATNFTVSKLILGDEWLPKKGVPYQGNLS